MMRKFHIKELRVYLSATDIKEWPVEPLERFMCEFDDGVVMEVTTPRLDLSRWLWALQLSFNKLPIKSTHYISQKEVPWGVISKVMSDIYKSVFEVYHDKDIDKEVLWKIMYRAINDLYNYSVSEFKEFTRSVNALDYAEVYEHPEMVKIREDLRPNARSIEKAYVRSTEWLLNNTDLEHNPVVSDVRCGTSSTEQLNQCIICRGYTTDIDDHIYPDPIMANYYEGVHDPVESVMDSTLASKAMIYQGAPLEQTQYGNRKLQFSSARVDLLITGDCGSNVLSPITIDENRANGLLGLYYKHPKTGKLTEFTKQDGKDYNEMTLHFRVPMYCGYRDKACVCSTCYGTLARNIPHGTNIGIVASVSTQSEVSQRVLKVKHVESLTSIEPLEINPEEMKYITNDTDPSFVRLNPKIKGKGIKLLLRGEVRDRAINASRLSTVLLKDLDPQRSTAHLSQFREIIFELPYDGTRPDRRKVKVAKGSMPSFLSNDFLRWFVKEERVIEPDGFYHLNVDDWDFNKPFLELPRKQMSMKDFASEVEVFIRSSGDSSSKNLGRLKQLAQYNDPTDAMLDLYDLITSKVDVHMTHVSIVCLSMMVEAGSDSMELPPLNKKSRFAKHTVLLNMGSWGALAAYQGGSAELEKAEQYLNIDRPQHLMDPLWLPGQ